MKSHEPFIEPESTYYVYSPSLLGRSMFFYPLTCGHFFYAPGYHLHRAYEDICVIMDMNYQSVRNLVCRSLNYFD